MTKKNDPETPRTFGYDNNIIAIAIVCVLGAGGLAWYGYTTYTAPPYVSPHLGVGTPAS